jgi:peptide/nickel transport system substrate-binding protein
MSDPALVMLPAEGAEEALQAGVGTGIYRVAQRREAGLRLDRVAAHRKDGSAGWFDAVELLAMETSADRMAALQAGRADAAAEVDPCERIAPALRRRPRTVSLRSNRRLEIRAAGSNARALAEALKAGLDRAGLLHDLLGGKGRIGADHPLPLGRPPERDPERARNLLRRSGLDRATLALGPCLAGFPGLDRLVRALGRFGEETGLKFAAGGPRSDLILALAPAQPTEDLALRRFARTGVDDPARLVAQLAEARLMSNTASRQEIQAEIAQVLAKEALTVVPVFAYPQFAHSVRLTHLGHIGALDALDSARIAKRWFYGSFG